VIESPSAHICSFEILGIEARILVIEMLSAIERFVHSGLTVFYVSVVYSQKVTQTHFADIVVGNIISKQLTSSAKFRFFSSEIVRANFGMAFGLPIQMALYNDFFPSRCSRLHTRKRVAWSPAGAHFMISRTSSSGSF
jgi:hypothetical protein